jgi:5-methylcytosine-specific restriction endonuclease McrA
MNLYLYLTSIYSVFCPSSARCVNALKRLSKAGVSVLTERGGKAMVPKLLRRLAGRSASASGEGETLARQRPGIRRWERKRSTADPLPSAWVRMYVWRRDHGRCVQCGAQERVWFDYIVPVWEGGSITEANIRVMCERCSRDHRAARRRKGWRT